MRKVLIGVQARTHSQRLDRKAHLTIEGTPILQMVIESCVDVCRYLQKDREKLQACIYQAVLTPLEDPIAALYRGRIPVVEGSERNVLSRYIQAMKEFEADYIVRITADCVHIPTHIISKHIKSALIKERDYTTNVLIRTFKEGLDCQVFSKRLLEWMEENCKTDKELEHVGCSLSKENFPFKDKEGRPSICHVIGEYFEPEVHTSIDTQEDLDRAREHFKNLKNARNTARKYGIYVQ